MPPRLIRRKPLVARLRAWLDFGELFLRLSEELDSGDWDQWGRDWAGYIGLGLNFAMLVARANSTARSVSGDDVFGDGIAGTKWSTRFVGDF